MAFRRITRNVSDAYSDSSTSEIVASEYIAYCADRKTNCKFILVSGGNALNYEYVGTGCRQRCSRKRS